jgi:hypothetical protein
MSALPPKADIAERDWNVRFVPKADIPQSASVYVVRTCPLRTTRRPRRGRKEQHLTTTDQISLFLLLS